MSDEPAALSAELREQIRAWLAAYLAEPGVQHELRDIAAFGALPLYQDVGGCLALRPDGRVVQVIWDKPEASFGDADANWRTVALVTGAKRYPPLRALLPVRAPADDDCANCGGTGRLFGLAICGVCFGLGFAASP